VLQGYHKSRNALEGILFFSLMTEKGCQRNLTAMVEKDEED
jgi:hypothetical protein